MHLNDHTAQEKAMKAEERSEGATAAASSSTHVLIFPCPAQGHVNIMLKLAQLLALHNLHVTFLNIEFIHHRLLRFGELEALSTNYPTLQFKTIPDGLPQNHPRSGQQIVDLFISINLHAKPFLRDILISQSITCLIGDGFYGGLTNEVAHEVGIPIMHFRTISASCFWSYFCVPNLFQSNELPIRGDEDMDRIITRIPGMESLIRCRDLPSSCRDNHTFKARIPLKSIVFETHESLRARALILNTFEDLEGPVLSHLRRQFPQVFTIGPLHAILNTRIESSKSNNNTTLPQTLPSSTNSLWEVDRSCMAWLDSQPLKSVIYVSFGSITTITREKLMEVWYGLVNSKKPFLWVMRPDMMPGKEDEDEIPIELVEATKERGFMVGWAPQVEVLGHKAIGGFLTHSGWNSTLESIVAGVPMICWPYFADQQVNSRFVSEAWKLGLDMKDVCDRNVVEKMVNDLMVHRREEFLGSAQAMAVLANKSVSPGGSSYSNLDHLIQYIKSIS